MSVYVIDSNFFIDAHRKSYPLDVASSFWNKVKQLAEKGTIISIDKVKKELYQNKDALKRWCIANLPDNFFKDSRPIIREYRHVTEWAVSKSGNYLPNALNEFLAVDEADAYVVAYALADSNNKIVVTQEISEPYRKNKVKIPDACTALNIQYINIMDMFRQPGETF